MKKIALGILIGVVVLAVSGTVGGMYIPANQQAKDRAVAPDNSPVIDKSDSDWISQPYYVMSDNPILRAFLGVNHEFDGVFSTELDSVKLGLLKLMGVEVEPVQIYEIEVKPYCGDGKCIGQETPENCPEDCAAAVCGNGILEAGEECEVNYPCSQGYDCVGCKCVVVCYPDNQYPWGIIKVNSGSGGTGITVAVLDTGIDTDHPDLSYTECVTKVTHFKPDIKSCEDGHGHGTHVAGTVAANGKIKGVAPEVNLMAVKVCDRRGWCYGDDIAAGIYYAADQGANIISMSIGGDTPDSQVLTAIDYAVDTKGALVVAAAGNDGPVYGSIDYPGAYVKVIAVGAINSTEAVPDWSSRGINNGDYIIEEREVEFGTPGVSVESTYNNGCYTYMSGTSMATPHVSGLSAKLWQGSALATRTYLQSIAKDIWESGDDTATGFGLPIAP